MAEPSDKPGRLMNTPPSNLSVRAGGRPSVPGGPPRPGWRSADVVRAVALGLGVVAGAVALWEASTIVFTVFLGVLFGLAISSGVDRLARLHVPRGLGAFIVVLGFAGILSLIGLSIAPTLADQGREIESRVPEAIRQVESWLSREERVSLRTIAGHFPFARGERRDTAAAAQAPAAPPSTSASNVESQVTSGIAGVAGHLFGFVGSTLEIIIY